MLKFIVQLTFYERNFVIFCAECFIFLVFAIIVETVASAKPRELLQILACFLPAAIFFITNILVCKVTVFLVFFTPFCKTGQSVSLMDVMGGKITISLQELH